MMMIIMSEFYPLRPPIQSESKIPHWYNTLVSPKDPNMLEDITPIQYAAVKIQHLIDSKTNKEYGRIITTSGEEATFNLENFCFSCAMWADPLFDLDMPF